MILFSHRGFYHMYRFRQEGLRLEQENIRLAAENDRLARTIDRLQHDPEYIQDRIRQELNFVKKNELIFQFPPDKPGTAPNLTAGAATARRRLRPGSRPFPPGKPAPRSGSPDPGRVCPKRGQPPP